MTGRASLTGLAAALLAGSLVGCGGAPGATTGSATRDSAGIVIVENAGPVWIGDEAWTVPDSALVDIGGAAADPVYDLNQVAGAARLSDGRIVVANGSTAEVRFYDATGRHLATTGRRGSGPGEFRLLGALSSGPGDSLLALDVQLMRLTVIAPDGNAARSFSLGGRSGIPVPTEGRLSLALPLGLFGDGSVLGMYQTFRMNEARHGAFRDTALYVRFAPDGPARDTLGAFPGPEMEQMTLSFGSQSFSVPSAVPLGRQTAATAHGNRFYVAFNDRYEIEVRDTTGALLRLIRVAAEPRSITDADVTAHRQQQLDQLERMPQMRMAPEPMRAQFRQRVEQATYPETFPYLVDLVVDAAGRLWAQEVRPPLEEARQHAVFDSAGILLGRVILPERVRPVWIGADEIVAVWNDSDDVEHVRVYPIRRPAG